MCKLVFSSQAEKQYRRTATYVIPCEKGRQVLGTRVELPAICRRLSRTKAIFILTLYARHFKSLIIAPSLYTIHYSVYVARKRDGVFGNWTRLDLCTSSFSRKVLMHRLHGKTQFYDMKCKI